MGSTFCSLRAHIVFGTKERRPFIRENWRPDLHQYLGGTVKGLNAVPESVGGVADHVHLLISYGPTMAIADFVRELKKASSVWAGENHESAFRWQDGYSVFSVSASQKQRVRSYIETQDEHHRKLSFREELESLLIRHEIEFRPEYLD